MGEAVAAPAERGFNASVVVAVCFAIAVLEGYDIQSMGVAAPTLAPALRLAKDQVGVAASGAMVGLVFGALAGGWLADRFGRRPVLLIATVWFGVFSLATSVAWDFHSLLLARVVTGLGFGAAMPNLIAIATEISGPRRQAATVTAMFVGMPAGGAAAALLTRFAGAEFDWRLLFQVGGAAPLLIAPLAWALLPETRPSHAGRRDTAGALFGEGRAAATLLMWLAFAACLLILHLMLNWLPSLAIAKGLTHDDAALAALAFNLAGIAGGLGVGMAADRFGFRWPLAAAFLALVSVMAGLSAASGRTPIVILSGLAGFLVVGTQFTLYALAPRCYPAPVRASGAGAAVAAGRIGSVIGPLAAGVLLAGGASVGQVVSALIPVAMTAGVAAVLATWLARDYSGQLGSAGG